MSSLLGIAAGVMHVTDDGDDAALPVHIAAATSQFVMEFMALEGTSVHLRHWCAGVEPVSRTGGAHRVGAFGGAS